MYKTGVIVASSVMLLSGIAIVLPEFRTVSYNRAETTGDNSEVASKKQEDKDDSRPVVKHQSLPQPVEAIYMTSCVAGTPSLRSKLVDLIEDTEINSVIIDVKDYSGTISFSPESESWKSAWENSKCGAPDMREFVTELHEKGIYVIARITVFQDPFYSKSHPELSVKKKDGVSVWKDNKGLSFIDVGARPYWDHIVELARDTYNLGFDELNFDYVRYPSDGPMLDISFTLSGNYPGDNNKQANLEEFFKYLNEKIDDENLFAAYRHVNHGRNTATPWTSVDLFGMTTTNYDDLSIGQVQERAAPYFDFVAPMVYPSHYPKNAFGYDNPNHYPYEIVYHAMKTGVDRMVSSSTPLNGFTHTLVGSSSPAVYSKPVYTADKLRTWIQDFDYGGDYDVAEVKAQIKASRDAGVNSFMVWAPSNVYTRGALAAEN